jgi:hypothetical protein
MNSSSSSSSSLAAAEQLETQLFRLAQELVHAHVHHATRIVASVWMMMDDKEDEDEDEVELLVLGGGIALQERLGFLFVSAVDAQGPFDKTRIRPGQCLRRINDKRIERGTTLQDVQQQYCRAGQEQALPCATDRCSSRSSSRSRRRRRRITIETLDGWGTLNDNPLQIVVELEKDPTTTSPAAAVPLGLSFQKQNGSNEIWLTQVAKNASEGLFGVAAPQFREQPALPSQVIGINGVSTGPKSTTPTVIQQLQEAHPMVSLECRQLATTTTTTTLSPSNTNSSSVTFLVEPILQDTLTVELYKPTRETKLGIALRKSIQIQSILIAGLNNQNYCHASTVVVLQHVIDEEQHSSPQSRLLQVGQKLLQINGEPCPSTTAATIQRLQELEGTVTLKVATIDWNATSLATTTTATSNSAHNRILLPQPYYQQEGQQSAKRSIILSRLQ